MKRGTVEYRVRWRRAPHGPWKARLFQEEHAAKRFASFLVRPNPQMFTNDPGDVYDLAPVQEIVIQGRQVGPWSDTFIDVSTLPAYRRRQSMRYWE